MHSCHGIGVGLKLLSAYIPHIQMGSIDYIQLEPQWPNPEEITRVYTHMHLLQITEFLCIKHSQFLYIWLSVPPTMNSVLLRNFQISFKTK